MRGHSSNQSNPSEISLPGDERTGVFLRQRGIPSTVISSLLQGTVFSLRGEEWLSTNSKTQRYSFSAQHHIIWKTCRKRSCYRKCSYFSGWQKKTRSHSVYKWRAAQTFQFFDFILEGLGCWRRHVAISRECYPLCGDVNQNYKGGDAIFSSTHGISPRNFPQSSIVRLGTEAGRETEDRFYQEREGQEAYGGELDGLRCERHLCEAKDLCAGVCWSAWRMWHFQVKGNGRKLSPESFLPTPLSLPQSEHVTGM